MIYPDPKKTASVIVSRLHPSVGKMSDGGEVKPEQEMEPDEMGLHSAMEDFITAVHDKSPHGAKEALKAFLVQHADQNEEEQPQTAERQKDESEDGPGGGNDY